MLTLLLAFSFAGILFGQGQQDSAESIPAFTVYIDKPYTLGILGAQRVLVVDQDIASANIEAGKVVINGKKRGETLLIVWTGSARLTFNVKSEDSIVLKTMERMAEKEKATRLMQPLKVDFSYDYSDYCRGSATKSIKEHIRTDDFNLEMNAETPYGFFDSQTWFEKKKSIDFTPNHVSAIRNQLYELSDAKIGFLRGGNLAFGDNYYYLSELIYSGNRFWGISYGTLFKDQYSYSTIEKLKAGEFRYLFLGGREEEGGPSGLPADIKIVKTDSYHYGLRLDYGLSKRLDLYTMGFKHYGKDDFQRRDNALSMGANWLGANTTLNTELGYDGYATAFNIDARMNTKKLSLYGGFRNVEANFFSVGAVPLNQGTREFKLSSSYSLFPFLTVSGSADRTRNFLNPNPNNPGAFNGSYSTSIDIRLPKKVNASIYYSDQDNEGTSFPSRRKRFGLNANKSWEMPRGFLINNIFTSGRIENNKNTSFQDATQDYDSWDLYFNSGLSFKNGFSLNFDVQRSLLKELYSKQKSEPFLWSVYARYSKQLFNSPFSFFTTASYRDVKNVSSPVCYMVKENIFALSGELRFRARSGNLYASISFSDHRPEDSSNPDYVEMYFYLGGRISFDTGFRFNPACKIRGCVFKDVNGDGIKQKDEPGIPGITVFADKKSAVTDKNGRYNLGRIGAKVVDISLDPQTFPVGYSATEVSRHIEVTQGRRYNLDFALRSYTKIEGRVFNDVNADAVFDEGDGGIQGVTVRLSNGDWEETDRMGYFRFPEVAPGNLNIYIDTATIPEGYVSKTPIRQEIIAEEGRVAKQDFIFEAMHIISGKVYEKQEDKEKGVPNIKINVNTQSVQTDENGEFIIRGLKVKTYIVSIDEASIPPGYVVEGEKTKEIKFEPEPRIVKDLNFQIIKKGALKQRIQHSLRRLIKKSLVWLNRKKGDLVLACP